PFFTTKSVGTGTGLGLSICHRIVRDLGGDITVDSTAGQGARFRVTLPTAVADPSASPPPPLAIAPSPHRLRVLVIDDQVAIGNSLCLLLQHEADVVFETRARAALARLVAGERYDAILCDLMMPEMNGMDFHSAVLRDVPDLAKRIVFVTGGAFTPTAR